MGLEVSEIFRVAPRLWQLTGHYPSLERGVWNLGRSVADGLFRCRCVRSVGRPDTEMGG